MADPRPKAIISWSSGKDSACALLDVLRNDSYEVRFALTTLTSEFGRVSMHGVREELLDRQLEELGIAPLKVSIPYPCPNGTYEKVMTEALGVARDHGVTHVIFGDLFLEDIRRYREERLSSVGMTAVFPLWQRPTDALARTMLDEGIEARLTCVDPRRVPRSWAGRRYDQHLLDELPDGVDPCGENGEFHTVVTAGPMFASPIETKLGALHEQDGFVFADVLLASS